jgi:hypothetical protein
MVPGQTPHLLPAEPEVFVPDHIPPKLYESDAIPLSSNNNSMDSPVPIKTGNLDYSLSRPGGVAPVNKMSPVPSLVLESALFSEVLVPSEESDINVCEESGVQVSTENLLSMLDLMAGGKTSLATENLPVDCGQTVQPPTDTVAFSEEIAKQGKQEGALFLEWVRDSIEDGTLSVNEKDSILHVLAQFVFLVSPACFYRHLSKTERSGEDKDRLQKSFELLNVHHSRNGKGLFHYHQYDAPDKSGHFTKVSGYMINADIIFKKGSCPPDSIWLSAKK